MTINTCVNDRVSDEDEFDGLLQGSSLVDLGLNLLDNLLHIKLGSLDGVVDLDQCRGSELSRFKQNKQGKKTRRTSQYFWVERGDSKDSRREKSGGTEIGKTVRQGKGVGDNALRLGLDQ